ncbi:MAG: 7-carboxy-7-deazaguanine synthase QueE [Gammaproteobacteria bacterium]|nr:7-carboxy-7-deazaguanine synthase QueE [Gammaproteobacteria bacterium]
MAKEQDDRRLRITEIFYSLQGEAATVGVPTVFIRLTGCPLRCGYCDTSYAFQGGEWRTVEQILTQCREYPTRYVTVTGGEPLAQKNCLLLLQALCDAGFLVSLETSGALDIAAVDPRVSRVMDIKTPGSGEADRNLPDNIHCLTAHDQIKFVLCDRADYEWAKNVLAQTTFPEGCEIFFSATAGQLSAATLADWILQDGLQVRLQIQLHKYLWGDEQGR